MSDIEHLVTVTSRPDGWLQATCECGWESSSLRHWHMSHEADRDAAEHLVDVMSSKIDAAERMEDR